MTNNRNYEDIIKENLKLKSQIKEKNREIEKAKKRLNILEKEVQNMRRQKNNNKIKNRGKSVGMRNNINLNNNYDNDAFNINGGMFNNNDPFSDPFFNFNDNMPNYDEF